MAAKSLEQITQEYIGQLQWVILTMRAEIEKLKEEIEKLKSVSN